MVTNFSFTIVSIFYATLLFVVFFAKKRLNSIPNKIYSYLVIVTFVGGICSIGTYIFMLNADSYPILNYIFARIYLVFLLTVNLLMTYYTVYVTVSLKNKLSIWNKKLFYIKIVMIICYFLAFSLFWILPIYYNSVSGSVYSYGPGVEVMYWFGRICSGIWVFLIILNIKNITSKKYWPMIVFVTLSIISTVIQSVNKSYLLTTSTVVFSIFLMYFTIENPDMKMIEQLNFEKDRADKANNAKSEFLSNMSHEIRTPLNAIVGFSQSLADEELSPDAQSELKDIIMAGENLVDLVNGILDISKIEANKLEIIDVEYSFKKIFDDLVSLTKARMGEKPLEFKIKYDDSIPEVLYGDQSRLKQIILNLLTNAVKYTKDGYILLKVDSVIKDNICRLIISVEDTGIGIKKENIDKLFSKFERLGVEKDITIEGTGLGLAITKNLVHLMGGNIVVQSEYGKGSRFTIAIDQRIILDKKSTDLLEKTQRIDISALRVADRKVLVVDDNVLNLKVAERLLKKYNLVVDCVHSGDDCLTKINNGEYYDLILLDDMMPKMSGVETLKLLKSNARFSIPVVVLTANAISGMKEKYFADGFDDYLSKPIELNELNRVIKKYLDK